MLELSSIARAALVLDALTKQAKVQVVRSEATTPGKFLILFKGSEGEVEEALGKGVAMAGAALLDRLWLPDAHPEVLPLLAGLSRPLVADESLLVHEYTHVATALRALDRALKSALVEAKKLHVARGIGGKAYFILGGTLDAVEAADEAARGAGEADRLVASETIARLSGDVTLEML